MAFNQAGSGGTSWLNFLSELHPEWMFVTQIAYDLCDCLKIDINKKYQCAVPLYSLGQRKIDRKRNRYICFRQKD